MKFLSEKNCDLVTWKEKFFNQTFDANQNIVVSYVGSCELLFFSWTRIYNSLLICINHVPLFNNRNLKFSSLKLFHIYFSDRVEEVDAEVQTERFLNRLPSPLYIPQATGRSTATQIQAGEVAIICFVFVRNFIRKIFSYLILILK